MTQKGYSGFGLFLVILLGFALAMAWTGPSPTGGPDLAADGGQTRESIMARQKGLGLTGDYQLSSDLAALSGSPGTRLPAGADNSAGVAQLGTLGAASDADVWRALKSGAIASPSSDTAAGGLIQFMGEDWRLVRRDLILPYAGWILLGVLCLIALFYIVRGRIPIRAGRSGRTIPRFSITDRVAHWFLAGTFLLMAISGLIILLGRPVLVPLIGRDANAVLVSASLQGHNLFGPVFIVALLLVAVRFVRKNLFQWVDAAWLLKGGGMLGGHASAGMFNFGEKVWYWIVVLVGLTMSATGLLLEFPWVTDILAWHQLATVLHAGGAILLIAGAFGHIYIGTLGMEGSIDSMVTGKVDENWAKEHHDLWYEDVTGKPAGHDEIPPEGADAVGEHA
ncbi:MAG: formate dehydrogenase subunit gamma [Marinibacterium sp.]